MDKKKNNSNQKKLIVIIKLITIVFSFAVSFSYTIKFLDKINLEVDDLFLKSLINNSNNIKSEGISSEIVSYISKLDLFDPINLLKSNYKKLVFHDNYLSNNDNDDISSSEPVINTDSVNNNNKPIVYIYNTHQQEEYALNNQSSYNVHPTVLLSSYILQDRLQQYGMNSIVEDNDIAELLRINNWNYASSYRLTKLLMEQAKKDNPSLIYFIDLHRDSISKDKTTITIEDKTYAKVLFLLGLENKNYKESQKVISRLNTIISEQYPGLSKGIYEKGGAGVDGVYNQDFSSKCVLIEVGGVDNTIDEVTNTIDAIAYMLKTYIGEDNE